MEKTTLKNLNHSKSKEAHHDTNQPYRKQLSTNYLIKSFLSVSNLSQNVL